MLLYALYQIGVLIEDTELVDSRMAGKPWKAGKFSSSLRLSLWSEHLGLRTGEVCVIFSIMFLRSGLRYFSI
jgi:hypothetical protein